MRIGLRVLSNPGWTGGIHYVLNIARMLRALPKGERPQQVVFLAPTPEAEVIANEHPDLADAVAPFTDAASFELDFVYPATQLSEAPMGSPWAGWIPDWQCRHLPELFSDQERARRFIQYRVLAQRCALTVVSSRMALEDTLRIFDSKTAPLRMLRFPAIFDHEVYDRSDEQIAATAARHGVTGKYALICNQFWVHKNHAVAFEALRRVRGDVKLVMTGQPDDERWPDYSARIRELLVDPAIKDRVVLTGRIPRSDQIDLMLGALAFVQPSRFEGWSTFVEEARALGQPLLISEFPVHREQAPEGSVFFDPDSAADLADKLNAWFEVPPQRSKALARARHAEFVLSCARDFMEIARSTRANFQPGVHDPANMAIGALAELHRDVLAGANGVGEEDEARFQAGVRRLLSDYPEDLALFCNAIAGPAPPLGDRGVKVMVAATLRKMSPQGRARFIEAGRIAGGAAKALAEKVSAEMDSA